MTGRQRQSWRRDMSPNPPVRTTKETTQLTSRHDDCDADVALKVGGDALLAVAPPAWLVVQ